MDGLIPISNLNDFLFCPYSIYLHGIYQGAEEQAVKATVQNEGTRAHKEKEKTAEGAKLVSLPVLSEKLGVFGIIDKYDPASGILTEYKNHLDRVFEGQIIQLQCQALCLSEMGYHVTELRLFDIFKGTAVDIGFPNGKDRRRITELIEEYRGWSPEREIQVNPAKCRKCIYCALCEKSEMTNDF